MWIRGTLDAQQLGESVLVGVVSPPTISHATLGITGEGNRPEEGGRLLMGRVLICLGLLWQAFPVAAGVGDPQVETGHPWYPGERAAASFERLFATQHRIYTHVTGRPTASDEDRALAAWLWRNTHYFHGTDGAADLWGQGFERGPDRVNREYWTGLFAFGFGLCGTTHAQWTAELNALLGHNRSRVCGVPGHNSLEVFLRGGVYGEGQWVLLDHDVSTVIFAENERRLLGLAEIVPRYRQLTDRSYRPEKQHGWLVCGLHPGDGEVFSRFATAEYLAGYAGPPPCVHLRRGETLRRYLQPGLADGQTFVYWGRHDGDKTIPGPSRAQTWVNQPEAMYGSKTGTPYRPGQARYGNAVYSYVPDFQTLDYREAVVAEDEDSVTLEFRTPYVIAATPAEWKEWSIYQPGCRNGLRLYGSAACQVAVSTSRGASWSRPVSFADGLDLTDAVKGAQQYWLRLIGPKSARGQWKLRIETVCQANPALIPHLEAGVNRLLISTGNRAVVSAGPTRPAAQTHVVDGAFDSPRVTLALRTPRGEVPREVYAAAHVASSNPPDPAVKYQIEWSADEGKTWTPIVRDWSITRVGQEPEDFWSQSFVYGSARLPETFTGKETLLVRFRNSGGKRFLRAEAHLIYALPARDDVRLTWGWKTRSGSLQTASAVFHASPTPHEPQAWTFSVGDVAETRWVEWSVVPR
uniref:Uncharacterized protein n=1 Tax=Schlesneria paludicola TaxID=360056 RepID=A0A7C4QQY5_9PLAN